MHGPFIAKLELASPFKIDQIQLAEFGTQVAAAADVNAADPNVPPAKPALSKPKQLIWVLAIVVIAVGAGIMLRRGGKA